MQGMRLFYLPLDWLSMEGSRTIEWLISVFKNPLVIAEKITDVVVEDYLLEVEE